MEKVILLVRVSTDRQEYRRQINELNEFCAKMNWEIVGTFANKVSGAESIENRTEITEMIEFVRTNDVKRVVCIEISRLGHNTFNNTPEHMAALSFWGPYALRRSVNFVFLLLAWQNKQVSFALARASVCRFFFS